MTTTERIASTSTDTEWLAFHIHYAAAPDPVLVDCIAPLVRRLREQGRIRCWFFIRYWVEGPHLRLRLLPSTPLVAPLVRDMAMEAIEEFLARRPALYEPTRTDWDEENRRLYVIEYGASAWEQRYGSTGMPQRPNNTVVQCRYEAEFERYGGPAGIDLAHWNFENASDIALEMVRTSNLHLRTVAYGLVTQLVAGLVMGALGGSRSATTFLRDYSDMWGGRFQLPEDGRVEEYDELYEGMRDGLQDRVLAIRSTVLGDGGWGVAPAVRRWAEHGRELRDHVGTACAAGTIRLRPLGHVTAGPPVTDPDAVTRQLLASYIHMMNNRLGVSIHEEVYLTYVLHRALDDSEHRPDPE